MKKLLTLAVVAGLVAGAMAMPAVAKPKKHKKPAVIVPVTRTVTVDYTGPDLGVATPAFTGGGCFNGGGAGGSGAFACLAVPPTGTDLYVKVEVTDADGQKVGGFLSQGDTNGDGIDDGYGQFCGSTPAPVAVTAPGTDLGISIYNGLCADASAPSIATTGTIKLTFSNMP